MDVMAELKPIGLLYSGGNLRVGQRQLQSLWAAVPEPKADTPNAYLIVEYGVAFSLKDHDLDQAQEWADRAPLFAAKRHDMGEVEFLIGKVAFERGEIERAREQFLIAHTKSEGRAFAGKDERYKRLIG
ncbi:hypothetical protein [Phenylobacterium montanum]|uniref:Tetratricopeptide repeat protein n=1 Tax=Phenylobacterium montanum TaxID=2823693 RepID=A0A975G0J3_9CAUL|nr:hypothetical protein [Caulobacter sp. S6]QUD88690.1 hypothetical protein KCG34_02030 [Caulobacter sp. S6]